MTNEKTDYSHLWLSQPWAIATYLAVSLVVFLLAGFGAWCTNCFHHCCGQLPPERIASLKLVIYAFSFGGVGATCYSIYGLYTHVAAGDYDHSYMYWYLFRGPIGAVLGLASYLLLVAGLITITDVDTSKIIQVSPSFKSKAAIAVIAFLAGFSANQFTDKLKALGQTLFGTDTHKDKKEFKAKKERQEADKKAAWADKKDDKQGPAA